MSFVASLDRRDQRLLLITVVLVVCTTVLLTLVHPEEQRDNYIPSTYSTAPHGAKAAYLLLAQLGYRVERSEASLDAIADTADAHTVLILAQPSRTPSQQEIAAVKRLLARGGRVLAAGSLAASALPQENIDSKSPPQLIGGICEAEPVSLSPLAAGGKVMMRDVRSVWNLDRPSQHAIFECAGKGVVVTYSAEKGTVVWWASASPLENQDVAGQGSLDLLLNSLQLQRGDRIVWDESLHRVPVAAWDPLSDRIILVLLGQLLLVGLLLVLARGRRNGPLRPLPIPTRRSPMEFVRSLGGLYRASGANNVPVAIAYERFRTRLVQHYGIAGAQTADAATLAAMLAERFQLDRTSLENDLKACEEAARISELRPRQALALAKSLARWQANITHHRGTLGAKLANHLTQRTA